MGYTNVSTFIGGIPEWRNFNYPMTVNKDILSIKVKILSPNTISKMLAEDPTIFVIDVRPYDYAHLQHFIKGSMRCATVEIADRYEEIPKDRKIIITDAYFKQSPIAAKYLIQKGYQVIGVLRGGIVRWIEEGLPTETEDL